MNVRFVQVHAMECMYTQTRPQFTPISKGVVGTGTSVNSKGKIPHNQMAESLELMMLHHTG